MKNSGDRQYSFLKLSALFVFVLGSLFLISLPANFSWNPAFSTQGLLKFTVKELPPFEEPDIMLSPEELEKLPFHMRPRSRADLGGRRLSLVVELSIDGKTWINKAFDPTGFQKDGPIFIYKETYLAPGEHNLLMNIRYARTGEEYIKLEKKLAIRGGEVRVVELNMGKIDIR